MPCKHEGGSDPCSLFPSGECKVCAHNRYKRNRERISIYGRSRYIAKKNAGVCMSHPSRPAILGETRCAECSERRSKYIAALRGTPEGRAHTLVHYARTRAKERGIDFGLSEAAEQRIAEVLRSGQCKVSGLPFSLYGGLTYDSPSLDQIKAGQGYFWENIRVVLHVVNMGMSNFGKETALFVWGHAIAKHALKDGNADLAAAILEYIVKFTPTADVPETQD